MPVRCSRTRRRTPVPLAGRTRAHHEAGGYLRRRSATSTTSTRSPTRLSASVSGPSQPRRHRLHDDRPLERRVPVLVRRGVSHARNTSGKIGAATSRLPHHPGRNGREEMLFCGPASRPSFSGCSNGLELSVRCATTGDCRRLPIQRPSGWRACLKGVDRGGVSVYIAASPSLAVAA